MIENIAIMHIICYYMYIIYCGGGYMATINVNVDEKVKEQAKETLEYLGTNFTNVINMLLRQIILTESIPFSVSSIAFLVSAFNLGIFTSNGRTPCKIICL